MIYLIQAGEGGPVKIGVAKNPMERLRELQVGHSEKLVLIDCIDAFYSYENEQNLHHELEHLRIRGEWFQPEKEVFSRFEQCKVMELIGPTYDMAFCCNCNMAVSYGMWT